MRNSFDSQTSKPAAGSRTPAVEYLLGDNRLTCRLPAAGIGLLLFFFLLLLTGCGGRSLNRSAAQDLIVHLPQDYLNKEDVHIESVGQSGEKNAVVEVRLRTAFRFEKTGGKWVIKEVRVGHGQWESLEAILRTLERVKIEETKRQLESVAAAIEKYGEKNGRLPAFTNFVSLTDALSPEYLTPLVRLDAWGRPLVAARLGPKTVRLISTGSDGELGTSDDIELTKTLLRE